MHKKRLAALIFSLIAISLWAAPAGAGGWVVVTLTYLPVDITPGEPFRVEFTVRDHGRVLGSGHIPTLFFYRASGQDPLRIQAFQNGRTGHYAAKVTLPESGKWSWAISPYDAQDTAQTMPGLTLPSAGSGSHANGTALPLTLSLVVGGILIAVLMAFVFFRHRSRAALGLGIAAALLSLLAIPALLNDGVDTALAAQPNALLSYSGPELFMAKGCVVCHTHNLTPEEFRGIQSNIGPNLSDIKLPPEYLRPWLDNPPAIKPKTQMPDLNLTRGEIDILVDFLTGR